MNQSSDHRATVDTVAEHSEWQQRQERRFAFGCAGNCNQGRSACDCYSDEVLDSQAPAPCDPTPAPAPRGFRFAAACIVGVVALASAAAWIGWLAV